MATKHNICIPQKGRKKKEKRKTKAKADLKLNEVLKLRWKFAQRKGGQNSLCGEDNN